ncbi:MAG TPA: hypothetical protein VFT13_12265, partial [Candidatus Krumholzibacteria bacterium]|nr:hypothetical protein [Candidatus Krumholzibacteria bacterium]
NVGVIFEQPPRIICFRASDGEFVEDFRFTEDPDHPFQRLSRVVHRGTSFVTYASDITQDSDGMRITGRIMRFDEAGTFLGQCDSLGFEFSFAKPVVRERYDLMWAVGPDGRVYINRDRDYGFTVHGNDCGIKHRFARGYEPVKRSTAELDSLREFYRRVGNMGDAKLELLENARDIAWLSADDAGRLWVLSSRGRLNLPADSLAFFDVFDSRGRLECMVEMKAERGDRDWYHMDRDRFFVVHRETMSLVAFEMPKLIRQ